MQFYTHVWILLVLYGKKKKHTGPGYLTLYENTDWRTREAKKNACNDYLKD